MCVIVADIILSIYRGHEWYTLVFVNRKAEQEPCHNEDKTLADIRYYILQYSPPTLLKLGLVRTSKQL